jgi:hypothetical protein
LVEEQYLAVAVLLDVEARRSHYVSGTQLRVRRSQNARPAKSP